MKDLVTNTKRFAEVLLKITRMFPKILYPTKCKNTLQPNNGHLLMIIWDYKENTLIHHFKMFYCLSKYGIRGEVGAITCFIGRTINLEMLSLSAPTPKPQTQKFMAFHT